MAVQTQKMANAQGKPEGLHAVALRPPFFGDGTGAELHRYFEPEFMALFQRDLQRHQITAAELNQWKQQDAFSKYDHKPVLRLPMHKSFYLVSCEVVCDRMGHPALDPQKIKSAGFVIRRHSVASGAGGGQLSWMIEDDKALGWEATPTDQRDPDINRRFCCDKARKLAGISDDPIATYTGEQTHPMHPLLVKDAKGKCHTILHGYLPLGGSYNVPQSASRSIAGKRGLTKGIGFSKSASADSIFDAASLADFKRITAAQLLWPFGFRPAKGASSLDKTWTADCARPVTKGKPTAAFFELLKILVNRYHLGTAQLGGSTENDNSRLEEWAGRQYFYAEIAHSSLKPESFSDSSRSSFHSARKFSLLDWLKAFSAQSAMESAAETESRLINYMAVQEKAADLNLEGFNFPVLPGKTSGNLSYSLYLSTADAQELRSLLDQRVLDNVVNKANQIPMPKFTQGKDDYYQIIPFIRVEDDCGHEHIIWAGTKARSDLFRVAAPFDANASRPSLIQMPSLADLRGGFANGVSMITPGDTFALLDKLNLKKGISEDLVPSGGVGSSAGLGIQWICSFSIPVITFVAMILLMVVVILLNIVFFWLPFVRICLPFPSVKK